MESDSEILKFEAGIGMGQFYILCVRDARGYNTLATVRELPMFNLTK